MHICMNLERELLDRLERIHAERKTSELAERSGVEQSNISRAISKTKRQKLGLDKVSKLLEAMGAIIRFPDQMPIVPPTKDVVFVNSRVVNAEDGAPPLIPEDYLAVPLTSEAGAGPGIVPVNDHESWFLVYRAEPTLRFRTNLIAVRVAKGSTSMEPTLHPGDIVLVDRDDKKVTTAGNIWLVMEPDGSGKVKRVKIDDLREKRQTRVTFYSDNVQENPPEVFTLEEDYGGDWERAIVGRVVWAWSDLSRK